MELAFDLCDEIVVLSRGTLKKVERGALDEEAFKEKIIEILKEGDHA